MTEPTLRERLRPMELVGLSAALAIFAGLVVLMSTRDVILAVITFGIAFAVSLVVIAMLALAVAPSGEERMDILDQDRDQRGGVPGSGPTH